jgi:hypothetical protein
MEKQIVTKKNTTKNPQAQGSKTNLKQGRNKRDPGEGGGEVVVSSVLQQQSKRETRADDDDDNNKPDKPQSTREREERERRETERDRERKGTVQITFCIRNVYYGEAERHVKCNPAPGTSTNRDTERHVRCSFRQPPRTSTRREYRMSCRGAEAGGWGVG